MEDTGKRILLFVVLAAVIFIGWQWLFPPEKPARKPTPEQAVEAGPPPAQTSPVGTPSTGSTPLISTETGGDETIVMSEQAVEVTFSAVGGVARTWELLDDPVKGRVKHDKLYDVDWPGAGLGQLNFLNSTYVLDPTARWKSERLGPRKVRFTFASPQLEVVKEFELFPDDYVLKMSVEVLVPTGVPGDITEQLALSLLGHAAADGKLPSANGGCHLNGSASYVSGSKLLRDGVRERRGTVRWIALGRKYDMVAMAPRLGQDTDLACNSYPVEARKDGVQVDLVFQPAKLTSADPPMRREVVFYVGPKYLDRLEHADDIAGFSTHFRDVIDLGWLSFLAKPMLWLLGRLFDMVGNWGLAIILLTLLVKLATLYWTNKSMRSMRAMAALKPQIEEIQKKYPDDKTKQQQAQMALFKQHGVSPLSGCLPMLLQMPIWFALYRMLSGAGELHQAVFIPGWLDDLTAKDPYYILPIVLTGMMFLQSRINPATGDSMQQKLLMYGMPIMFGVMSLVFPSGLTVYIFTNTCLGIVHALYMKRADAHKAAAQASAQAATKGPKSAEDGKDELPARGAGKTGRSGGRPRRNSQAAGGGRERTRDAEAERGAGKAASRADDGDEGELGEGGDGDDEGELDEAGGDEGELDEAGTDDSGDAAAGGGQNGQRAAARRQGGKGGKGSQRRGKRRGKRR